MFADLFSFRGRIGRGGWWFAQFLGLIVVTIWFGLGASVVKESLTTENQLDGNMLFLFIASIAAVLSLNICSTVKRYHDRGKSGWWLFVTVVPVVGGFWQFIECGFCSGDDGPNNYGPPVGTEQLLSSNDAQLEPVDDRSISRLDDNYMFEYAKQLSKAKAQSQTLSHPDRSTPAGPARPVFGKR